MQNVLVGTLNSRCRFITLLFVTEDRLPRNIYFIFLAKFCRRKEKALVALSSSLSVSIDARAFCDKNANMNGPFCSDNSQLLLSPRSPGRAGKRDFRWWLRKRAAGCLIFTTRTRSLFPLKYRRFFAKRKGRRLRDSRHSIDYLLFVPRLNETNSFSTIRFWRDQFNRQTATEK